MCARVYTDKVPVKLTLCPFLSFLCTWLRGFNGSRVRRSGHHRSTSRGRRASKTNVEQDRIHPVCFPRLSWRGPREAGPFMAAVDGGTADLPKTASSPWPSPHHLPQEDLSSRPRHHVCAPVRVPHAHGLRPGGLCAGWPASRTLLRLHSSLQGRGCLLAANSLVIVVNAPLRSKPFVKLLSEKRSPDKRFREDHNRFNHRNSTALMTPVWTWGNRHHRGLG